jgi:EmrB/QacA subfamily drug resistance transporter
MSRRRLWLVFAGLLTGMFLAALDLLVVATAIGAIAGDLGNLTKVSWVFTAYLLGLTATMPLYGKLGDLFGRKRVFQVAIVLFMLGSVLAGAARTMPQLIAFRALQGLGGGGLTTLPMAIVADLVPPRERGRYAGLNGSVWAVSSLIGPLVGGFFVDHLSWRWVFYVNLPTGIVALLLVASFLDVPHRRVEHRIDWRGAVLVPSAVVAVLLVTTWGGEDHAWDSPVIVGLIAGSVVLVAAVVHVERRVVEPIQPLHLFANPIVRWSAATSFFVGLANFGMAIYVPLFMQVVNGRSPTVAGLGLAPTSLGIFVSATVIGRLVMRRGRYRIYPVVGAVVFAAGCYLLASWDQDTPLLLQFASTLCCGLGTGMVTPVVLLASQNAVAHRDVGTVSSLAMFGRSIGQAIGGAVVGAVFAARLDTWIGRLAVGDDLGGLTARDLRANPSHVDDLVGAARLHAVDAFRHAINDALFVAVPVAVLAALCALFIRDRPLRTSFDEREEPAPAVAAASTD